MNSFLSALLCCIRIFYNFIKQIMEKETRSYNVSRKNYQNVIQKHTTSNCYIYTYSDIPLKNISAKISEQKQSDLAKYHILSR